MPEPFYPQTLNRYAYAYNNPVMDGHEGFWSTVGSYASSAWSGIKSAASWAWGGISSAWSGISSAATWGWGKMSSAATYFSSVSGSSVTQSSSPALIVGSSPSTVVGGGGGASPTSVVGGGTLGNLYAGNYDSGIVYDWTGQSWSEYSPDIIYRESGNGKTYGADVLIMPDANTVTGEYQGSTYHNSGKNPTIEEGWYNYSTGMHHPSRSDGYPALILNNNKDVPTTGPNPNNLKGAATANAIHIHSGDSNKWRGSTGCLTVSPSQWSGFMRNFPSGARGRVGVYR